MCICDDDTWTLWVLEQQGAETLVGVRALADVGEGLGCKTRIPGSKANVGIPYPNRLL